MNPDKRRDRELYARPVRQLCIFVLAVLLLTQVALSAYAWTLSEHRFLPELERKAKVVGASVSAKLARAIGFGIPFNKLEGVTEFYDEILRENADVAYLTLTDASGKVLARGGRFRVLEGTDRFSRFVVIEFPSLEQAVACHDSPEYMAASAYRKAKGVGEVELAIVEALA